jgi:hypothetical protein
MADTARASSAWSLKGTTGTLTCGKLSGSLDVARPHFGLHRPEFDYNSVPCAFVGVMRAPELPVTIASFEHSDNCGWPLAVAESYVRGNDLVAAYHPNDAWPYAPQIYWQAHPSNSVTPALASMSLLVSVQTPLLDTHPKILVTSQIPTSELYYVPIGDNLRAKPALIESDHTVKPDGQACCIVRRILAAPLSYVEFMSATDFHELTCTPASNGKAYVEWHLFSEFLEKGVIRRARVHGALLPRENDIELAIECCSIFENSPLPLTA